MGHSEVDEGHDTPVPARRRRERLSDNQEQPQPAAQSKPENLAEDEKKAARRIEDATRSEQARPTEVDQRKSMRPSETERESGYVRVTEEAKKRLSEIPKTEEREDERYFTLKRAFITAAEEYRRSRVQEQAKSAELHQAPEAQPQTDSPRAKEAERTEAKKEALKGPFPKDSRSRN